MEISSIHQPQYQYGLDPFLNRSLVRVFMDSGVQTVSLNRDAILCVQLIETGNGRRVAGAGTEEDGHG